MLVNMTLACLLLMQSWCLVVLVMYDLYGAFPHTGRRLSYQISVFLSEGVCRVSPLHWLTAEVTDRPPGTGVFPLMADVAI